MISILPAPCRRVALVLVSLLLALGLSLPAAAAGGGGGGGMGAGGSASLPTGPRDAKSPQETAKKHYARGLRHRERALEYEAKAKEKDKGFLFLASPSEKAEKEWKEALEDFQKAVASRRDYHEAYNEIGYAQRKLGRYEKALEAYDRALALEPGYPRAVEYRGEAYLKLGRLDDVKTSYMKLFLIDRELADQLMAAIEEWLGEAGDAPVEGVSAEELDGFRSWAQERAQLARQTGGSVSDARRW